VRLCLPSLLLLMVLPACGPVVGAPGDDDDDSAGIEPPEWQPPPITAATVAGSLELLGTLPQEPEEPGVLFGQLQILYWSELDSGELACRQRFDVEGRFLPGPNVEDGCVPCDGVVQFERARPANEGRDDDCGPLPGDRDLGFLLSPGQGLPTDLRNLPFVHIDELIDAGYLLALEGLAPEHIVERYAQVGLRVDAFAGVSSDSWLANDALLADVATGWGDPKMYPFLALYREDGAPPLPAPGEVFVSALWTIRLGDGLSAEPQR
jgi:hypothetical protein